MNPIIAQVIAKRASQGFVLRFEIPGRANVFVCYPKDEAQKQAWISKARERGWRQV